MLGILHNAALSYYLDLQIENEEVSVRLPGNDVLLDISDNRLGNIIKAAFIERHFTWVLSE